ncbi:3-phosphoglycerate dehydrogenase [Candidatus Bathyarchaeota archaeon]|jgi:D-3-phosphoglycerate dehydrogenase|nr:3-phosphoglycerate dehydrogenase [Candidatus Bathyarchaeota archaeon]MDP6048045.1 hydroxyacid dehydrogenase [Candidatus Bathyarchaeota archaeon]MDP7443252.1 hydroxyacid dehydrogenase [Candidatus Bathyarchaeota archaeon]|tara:strand:+ start:1147 stop:2106 length:960 start_codon:yes stop_codon:yes gene_type:complete
MPAHKVIVTEPIHKAGIKLLESKGVEVVQLPPSSNEETLKAEAPWAAALITRGGIKVTRGFMESAPLLKAVGVHGIGCDHVDLESAKDLGKIVLNTPFALSESVAEMAVALLFALSRRIVSADKAVRAGEWHRKYSDLWGIEVMGKTVGIVGLGKIGAATARRLKSFEVELLYHSRTRKPDLEQEICIEYATLDSLIERSDIISLSLPYTRETHHLIDARRIAAMKDGVYIVNTARGQIIDQVALIAALNNGKIAGAGLDVFAEEPLDPRNPLVSMDNVVLTPHLAASSEEAMKRMAVQVAEGVLKVLKGETPDYPVSG